MRYYLVAYDRRAGRRLSEEIFDDRIAAVKARQRLESELPIGTEIVILAATSRDAVEQTHARYYKTPAELASTL